MEKMILRATVTGAVVNVCANFALIPVLKQDGAAIASVLSEVVVTTILLVHAKKYYVLKFSRHYILSLVMALLVMLAVVFGMERLLGKSPWMVLLIIVAAGIVYFAVLLLLHNEIVEKLVKKIKSRGKHL
jgi:peptidoglycan biosynthesis protein MviN/MurJ (putative lipid II flippase)